MRPVAVCLADRSGFQRGNRRIRSGQLAVQRVALLMWCCWKRQGVSPDTSEHRPCSNGENRCEYLCPAVGRAGSTKNVPMPEAIAEKTALTLTSLDTGERDATPT